MRLAGLKYRMNQADYPQEHLVPGFYFLFLVWVITFLEFCVFMFHHNLKFDIPWLFWPFNMLTYIQIWLHHLISHSSSDLVVSGHQLEVVLNFFLVLRRAQTWSSYIHFSELLLLCCFQSEACMNIIIKLGATHWLKHDGWTEIQNAATVFHPSEYLSIQPCASGTMGNLKSHTCLVVSLLLMHQSFSKAWLNDKRSSLFFLYSSMVRQK